MILDGKKLALKIKTDLKRQIEKTGLQPGLASILVGNDPSSTLYISIKKREAKLIGMRFEKYNFKKNEESRIINFITKLDRDPRIHGILVQLPLPRGFNTQKIINTIDPRKDVDGFHPENVRLLLAGKPRFVSPPHGAILQLIKESRIKNYELRKGLRTVVLANSRIFAEPLKILLKRKGFKIQILYSKRITNYELGIIKRADIIIVAKGKPRFITASMIKNGAIVIDVGTNRLGGKLVGDVDFESVSLKAGAITPVPGGVGPMTVAMLLKNTVIAAKRLSD